MSMNRNELEQEAMQALNKGNLEGALSSLQAILRLDPRDRRTRQKVGELHLRLNRPAEAEKHLKEVADGFLKESNFRAAVAVLKQLAAIQPGDTALAAQLGEAYIQAGLPNDGKVWLEKAIQLAQANGRPAEAARAARRLAEISPLDLSLRIKAGELSELSGDTAGALALWTDVIEEFRRRGRVDEVARVAELALRIKGDDISLLLDAAAGRIDTGDFKKALSFLQPAFQAGPKEPRTLDLLARAFEGANQADKALRVLNELVRVAFDRGDLPQEADALRRASRLNSQDDALRQRLQEVEARLQRQGQKLYQLTVALPKEETELRAQVRAEVYLRYGFLDRAEVTARDGLKQHPDSLAILAVLAEIEQANGRAEEAAAAVERLLAKAPASERELLRERLGVLRPGLAELPLAEVDAEELVEDEEEGTDMRARPQAASPTAAPAVSAPAVSAPAVSAPKMSEAEVRGDQLAEAADFQGALLAWREALAFDPANERIVEKIASLRERARRAREAPAPVPAPVPVVAPAPVPVVAPAPVAAPEPEDAFARLLAESGTFAEINPDDPPPPPPRPQPQASGVGGGSEVARLLALDFYREAAAKVEADTSLAGRVLYARALWGLGEVVRALDVLKDASNSAAESDPGYDEALFLLARLNVATGKFKAAQRLLEELQDVHPSFMPDDVQARIKALKARG